MASPSSSMACPSRWCKASGSRSNSSSGTSTCMPWSISNPPPPPSTATPDTSTSEGLPPCRGRESLPDRARLPFSPGGEGAPRGRMRGLPAISAPGGLDECHHLPGFPRILPRDRPLPPKQQLPCPIHHHRARIPQDRERAPHIPLDLPIARQPDLQLV